MEDAERWSIISYEDQKALADREYEAVRLLGEGAFSKVVLVRKKALRQLQPEGKQLASLQEEDFTDYAACKIS